MLTPRRWQAEALDRWRSAKHRGIVEVVTGGGKTVFALMCARAIDVPTTLVVVPTIALLDQWWEEAASFFEIGLDEIHIVSRARALRPGTVNVAVLNTAARLALLSNRRPCFLIVDECHKAASPQYRAALDIPTVATLGLSATPERPYDDGLSTVLVPALGEVIYRYSYREALDDGVIVPFQLRNVIFELEDETSAEYDRLTKSIARAIARHGEESEQAIALLLRRAQVLNLSLGRVRLALRIAAAHRGQRILIFHENIEACNVIYEVLRENGIASGIYHSRLPLRERVKMLGAYRSGKFEILVTCRALDEGFNVPETQIGIIAASTATRRQRIQRLGRILRPSKDKGSAIVYTLVATRPEIDRLKVEEKELQGVTDVTWSHA